MSTISEITQANMCVQINERTLVQGHLPPDVSQVDLYNALQSVACAGMDNGCTVITKRARRYRKQTALIAGDGPHYAFMVELSYCNCPVSGEPQTAKDADDHPLGAFNVSTAELVQALANESVVVSEDALVPPSIALDSVQIMVEAFGSPVAPYMEEALKQLISPAVVAQAIGLNESALSIQTSPHVNVPPSPPPEPPFLPPPSPPSPPLGPPPSPRPPFSWPHHTAYDPLRSSAWFPGCLGRAESLACTALDCSKRVPLASLRAGDVVATLDANGAPALTRIIVNQHVADERVAPLLTLETAGGGASITVTADHVIALDGQFLAAAHAAVGRSLSAGAITRISETSGAVINPVTVAGTMLVTDKHGGAPVLTTTHPEWSATFMLAAPTFAFAASRLGSYLMPASTQAFYNVVEGTIDMALPSIKPATAACPTMLLVLGLLLADAAFAVGVLAYAVAVPISVTGVAILVVAGRNDRAASSSGWRCGVGRARMHGGGTC